MFRRVFELLFARFVVAASTPTRHAHHNATSRTIVEEMGMASPKRAMKS